MTDEFAWLDAPAAPKKRRTKKSARKAANRVPKIEAGNKIDHERLRGNVMFSSVKGRRRTWACDGSYVYFRRKNCYGKSPEGNTLVNDVAIRRHEEFISKGDYTYVETQDDVEIYKVNEQSPFHRKGLFLGQMDVGMIERAIVIAACKRDWVLYTDALIELAGRIKSHDPGPLGAAQWNERLAYLTQKIAARHGPLPEECSAGMQNVRMKRGESRGNVIVLPSRVVIPPPPADR